jgi:predicted RNA methylase
MTRLLNISTWCADLGYLPVPMYGEANERRHVLLNGGHGNFCLDLTDEAESDDPRRWRSRAWSCNVDHYVRIFKDRVNVTRWDTRDPEDYKLREVENALSNFQQRLEERAAPKARSVVAHAINIYRRLRSGFNGSGEDAILAYLGLLSAAWARQRNINLSHAWQDIDAASDFLKVIGPVSQEALLREMEMPSLDENDPLFDLILRHASGRIFQEAHYLVDVSPQFGFDGLTTVTPVGPATRQSGAYFTPTPLVRTVVEQALKHLDLKKPKLRLLDPACGSAEFLREALRQLEQRRYEGSVEVIGYDISIAACRMARFALAIESMRWPGRITVTIEQRDSLDEAPWPSEVSCCLMNPPFGAWGRIDTHRRQQLAKVLGPLYKHRPDIASAFALMASASLASDGVLGAVMPASLLDGKSSGPVRESLEHELDLALVARLGSQRVFSEATVDPALVVAKRISGKVRGRNNEPVMVWADHRTESPEKALRALRRLGSTSKFEPIVEDGFSIYQASPSDSAAAHWAPRAHSSYELFQRLKSLGRVTDYFDVRQGVLTGLNAAFILTSQEYDSLPEKERRYFRPAIMGDSISRGAITATDWVFYPYNEAGLIIRTETELRTSVPSYLERWLRPHQEALLNRAGIPKDCWWSLTRHRGWQIDRSPRFMSAYFGRSGAFAFDPTGDVVVVQGYAWLPRKADQMNSQIGFAMNALMTSSFADNLLGAVSNNLAGGQWNLSSRFMERLPFPNLWTKDAQPAVEALAWMGKRIQSEQAIDEKELGRWTDAIYGLVPRETRRVRTFDRAPITLPSSQSDGKVFRRTPLATSPTGRLTSPRSVSDPEQDTSNPVAIAARLLKSDEESVALAKCPEAVRSNKATRVIRLSVDIRQQKDLDALSDLLVETTPAPIDITFAKTHWQARPGSTAACIGIFPSGEVRTVGALTQTQLGSMFFTPYDYCSLLDPGDATQSADHQSALSLILDVVGMELLPE